MTPKQQIFAAVAQLPDDATYESALETLFFLHQIETGQQDVDSGKTHTHEEIEHLFLDAAISTQ